MHVCMCVMHVCMLLDHCFKISMYTLHEYIIALSHMWAAVCGLMHYMYVDH